MGKIVAGTVMVAAGTFWAGNKLVRAGDTAPAGHPLVRSHPTKWRPFELTFGSLAPAASATDAEQAVTPPAETR